MVRDFRILIVGAGFSKPAGLPLGNELFPEVRRRARERSGSDNWLERDLADYLTFRKRGDGVSISPESDEFDYEDFIAFLDVEHYLGLRGSDTWSDAGNEGQLILKRLIGKIIHERTMEALDALPDFYLRFAESLAPSDIVVTFNYDVLLERCLERLGRPYRLFPNRYSEIGRMANTVDSSRDGEEVTVLKMHGSVDWFSSASYESWEEYNRLQGFKTKPHDAIFEHPEVFKPTPLVDGPRSPEDPLLKIYRIDADKFYREPYPRETPVILSPSRVKIIYTDPVKEFWYGFQGAGAFQPSASTRHSAQTADARYCIRRAESSRYEASLIERRDTGPS